jgi:hypothetical protein
MNILRSQKFSIVLVLIIFLTACSSLPSDPNANLTKVGKPSNLPLLSLEVNENFSPNPWSKRLGLGNLDGQSWLPGTEVLKVRDLWILQSSKKDFLFFKPTMKRKEFFSLINLMRTEVQAGKVSYQVKLKCPELCTSNLFILEAENGKHYYLRFSELDGTSEISMSYLATLQNLLSTTKFQEYKSKIN